MHDWSQVSNCAQFINCLIVSKIIYLIIRSDKFVQGNIDRSDVMKELGAVALSVSGVPSQDCSVANKKRVQMEILEEIESST